MNLNKILKFSLSLIFIISILIFILVTIGSNAYNSLVKEKLNIHKECYADTPKKYNKEYSEQRIISEDQTIGFWEIKGEDKTSKKTFLFVHGYGGVKGGKSELLGLSMKFISDGDLILMDLPSFCTSSGNEITLGNKESIAIKQMVEYLKKADSEREIIIIGYSLGAFSASKFNYDNDWNSKIVAINPYYSIPAVLSEESIPSIRPLLELMNKKEDLKLYTSRENLIIMSGSNDPHISSKERALLEKSISNRFIELENNDHTSVLKTAYLNELHDKIIENIK